jgi:hypothetical protein
LGAAESAMTFSLHQREGISPDSKIALKAATATIE